MSSSLCIFLSSEGKQNRDSLQKWDWLTQMNTNRNIFRANISHVHFTSEEHSYVKLCEFLHGRKSAPNIQEDRKRLRGIAPPSPHFSAAAKDTLSSHKIFWLSSLCRRSFSFFRNTRALRRWQQQLLVRGQGQRSATLTGAHVPNSVDLKNKVRRLKFYRTKFGVFFVTVS